MTRVKQRKDTSIYDLLESQARVATESAEAFKTMAADFGNLAHHAQILDKLESDGDKLTHELQNKIATVFITPIDKEDLRELSQALDHSHQGGLEQQPGICGHSSNFTTPSRPFCFARYIALSARASTASIERP